MQRSVLQRMALAFFEEVFAARAIGVIEIRSTADRIRWHSSWCRSAAGAARAALRADALGRNVYFGAGLRDGRKKDGTAVRALGFAWADLDAHDIPADELADALVGIVDRLRAFSLQPSIVIATARGYHVYWLLVRPAPPELVCAINRELARALSTAGGDLAVCDPARLLRVPGTHHRLDQPRLVAPFGEWWAPGGQARRYGVEELLAATGAVPPDLRPAGAHDAMPRLLALVAERGRKSSRHTDGRVTLCCFFHDDEHPSAVVFANGWFFCSTCRISEPAAVWTKRPEVVGLGFAALVSRRTPIVALPSGYVKAPRSAISTVAPLLLPGRFSMATSRRGRTELRLLDHHGTNVPFDQPEVLAAAVRAKCGPLAFRLFWAAVVLAQVDHHRADTRGQFRLNVKRVGDLLGFPQGADGRHHHDHRHGIEQAMVGLAALEVRFRWSAAAATWFSGPIVVRLGEFRDGDEVHQLHPGLWRQIIGAAPAWAAWDPAALRLEDEALAVYLHARWQQRRALERKGDVPVTLSLPELALRAGVWNAERYAKDHGRYVAEWRRRLAQASGLGITLGLSAHTPVVHVRPVGDTPLAVGSHAERGRAAALPAYFPDLHTGIPENSEVSPEVHDRIPRDPTVFPRDPTNSDVASGLAALPDAPGTSCMVGLPHGRSDLTGLGRTAEAGE